MPVSDLVDALRLEQTGPNTYRAPNYEMGERGVVFGGQLIAQLIAAGATVDETKRVKSAHAVFARPVMVADPVELRVDVLQNGRTFASATTSLWQDGKERSRATVLLTADEPDLIRHSAPMPDRPSADETSPMGANPDVRVVGDVDILDADATGDPMVDVWFRRSGGVEGPGAHTIEQGLLAHSSASFLIGAAMRPHAGVGQSAAHAAFLDWHHRPHDQLPRADRPLRVASRVQPEHLRRPRPRYGVGEVFSSGRLVASFSQESMVRHFPEGISPEGQESTVL